VSDPSDPRDLPRRQALKILGAAVGSATVARWGGVTGLTGLAGLGGCAPRDAEDAGGGPVRDEPVRVPLDRLAVGERMTLQVGGIPVELHRTAEGVTARSLHCTHFGCTVAWTPARNAYVCPCHDGAYAPDGHVIYGPPPAPLPVLPVTVENGTVIVEPLPHDRPAAAGDGRAS